MSFIDDFLRGQRDCSKGVPHKQGQSEAYNRGYAAEYEMSAIKDEISLNQNEAVASHLKGNRDGF